MMGILPELLALHVRRKVPESPDWLPRSEAERRVGLSPVLRGHWRLTVFAIWGVVPVYLNEASPPPVSATFPDFAYQAGNFLAAANANIQIWLASRLGGDFSMTIRSYRGRHGAGAHGDDDVSAFQSE